MDKKRLQKLLKQKSVQDSENGCWEWIGQISNSGWGRTMITDDEGMTQTISACDASYMAYIGEIPKGGLVTLSCGNRLCINPEHLQLAD